MALCFLVKLGSAQTYFNRIGESLSDSTTNHLFELYGTRSDQSNSLTTKFVRKSLYGGYIDANLKDEVSSNLSSENAYFGNAVGGLRWTLFQQGKRLGWSFGYEVNGIAKTAFSQDLFTAALYGNAQFGAETANFENSGQSWMTFSKFTLGVVFQQSNNTSIELGIYSPHTYGNYDLGNMAMRTKYDTVSNVVFPTAIEISTANFESTEDNGDNGLFESGVGIGLSLEHQLEFNYGKLKVQAADIGVIYWQNLEQRDTAGTFDFSGFYWEYGENQDSRSIFEALRDSLSPDVKSADEWIVLPTRLSLEFTAPIGQSDKFYYSVGGYYQHGFELNPEFRGSFYTRYAKSNLAWVNFSFWGYYGATFGFGTEVVAFEKSRLLVTADYAPGLWDDSHRAMGVFFKYALTL